MKVNFNRPFRNYKGNETKEVIADKVAEALYSAGALREWPIRREDKFRAYKLCTMVISGGGEVEITRKDADLIEEVCSNFMTAGAYGQVYELIEGGM